MEDIVTMYKTRRTLTETTTQCAKLFPFGKGAVSECMRERVGLTPECQKCWTDNIFCTAANCVFTCAPMKFLPWLFDESHNSDSDNDTAGGIADGGDTTRREAAAAALNRCLECDEKICGRDFLSCAGANRRRTGIYSDIGRADESVFVDMDADWVEYALLHCEGENCELD
jgi:hypothetical protein